VVAEAAFLILETVTRHSVHTHSATMRIVDLVDFSALSWRLKFADSPISVGWWL
jgi:hypothetical protein